MSDYTLIPTRFKAVTKSDTDPVNAEIGLFIGGAGNVVVKGVDGVQATFACLAGSTITGKFQFVMAATTATNIVCLS
jgi:hypothetical protein